MSKQNSSPNVPAMLPAPVAPAPAGIVPPVYYLNGQPQNPAFAEPTVVLSHYLWIIRRHRWKILAFVLFCVLATFAISSRLTPIYESTAIVDIDRELPAGIMGQDALRSTPNDADQFLATQVKLIQSDAVLRPVAERFKLREREHQTTKNNKKMSPRSSITLRNLTVTRTPDTYLLLIGYRSADPNLAADVANAVANSYIENTYNIRFRSSVGLSAFMEKQLEELKAKMEKSGAALAKFERELNVINPEEKTSVISARLLQLNTEYTNAQADRVRKEAAFQSIKSGTLESAQISTQGEALKRLSERLSDAEEKFADVRNRLGTNHPEYKKAAYQVTELQVQRDSARQNIAQRVEAEYHESVSREHMLEKAIAETKGEFDRLNARSYEYHSLKNEAEADKKFYEELIHKIKEAGINSSFQNNSIRLADLARPSEIPIYPRVRFNVLLAFLLSTCFALGLALISDLLDKTLRDPEQVKRILNAKSVGTLPLVKTKGKLLAPVNGAGSSVSLLHGDAASDPAVRAYVEAVRTLRNSILLSNLDRHISSVLVTSAAPREGKSTTAVHLACAHAEQRHKTLLIDCDLRRPSIHHYFDIPNEKGIATVLTGSMDWREALTAVGEDGDLHVLPSGPVSRRAAELVGRGLGPILEEAANEYDLIIVDAPPMLGFAEPLQMASIVDGVVVVTLAGQTNRQAVASVFTMLATLNVNVLGLVLNSVHERLSEGYYYSGYYGKNYSKYYSATKS